MNLTKLFALILYFQIVNNNSWIS